MTEPKTCKFFERRNTEESHNPWCNTYRIMWEAFLYIISNSQAMKAVHLLQKKKSNTICNISYPTLTRVLEYETRLRYLPKLNTWQIEIKFLIFHCNSYMHYTFSAMACSCTLLFLGGDEIAATEQVDYLPWSQTLIVSGTQYCLQHHLEFYKEKHHTHRPHLHKQTLSIIIYIYILIW
jgi:hypothetical protein